MKYMTLQAMAEACHGVYIGNPEDIKKEAISITTDSRKAEQGGVFAAIKGERVDGHDFIPGVLEAASQAVSGRQAQRKWLRLYYHRNTAR